MQYGSFLKNSHIRSAATDVDHHYAEFFLAFREHGFGGGKTARNDVVDIHARLMHALFNVFHRRHKAGHKMCQNFQTDSGHSHRVFNARLFIYGKAFRNNSQNSSVVRDRHRLSGLQNAVNIILNNFISTVRNGNHTLGVHGRNMIAGNSQKHMVNRFARHTLGIFQSGRNVRNRFFHINNVSLSKSARRRNSHTNNIGSGTVFVHNGHGDSNFGVPNVEARNHSVFRHEATLVQVF